MIKNNNGKKKLSGNYVMCALNKEASRNYKLHVINGQQPLEKVLEFILPHNERAH